MNRPITPPLDPVITEQGETLDRAWYVLAWASVGVVVFVAVLVAFVLVRDRRRSDDLPRQKHYNIPMEVTYTVIPLLAIAAITVLTFVTVDATERGPDDDALQVHVTAFQWQWRFDYPDSGVTIIGGAEDDEEPVLVLPAGRQVTFELESLDVIHSFWVTSFRFKRDMIPGRSTSFTVDLLDDVAGSYPNAGVCAEFCGYDHARMRFGLLVLEPDEFDAWLAGQPSASPAEVGS